MKIQGFTVDKKWKYVANDCIGSQLLYEELPVRLKEGFFTKTRKGMFSIVTPFEPTLFSFALGPDWQESLHEIIHHDDGIELVKVKQLPNFEVDTLLLVWNSESDKFLRYFEEFNKHEKVCCFDSGATSLTAIDSSPWGGYKIPTEEEIKTYKNKRI